MENRTISLKQTFNTPLNLVWEAWIQPGQFSNLLGPKEVETKIIKHEFKVGGKWKYSMPLSNSLKFISEGEYTEIIQFEKIVSSANFSPMTQGVVIQAMFHEDGDQTNFTFNIIHPTVRYRIQQEQMGVMNVWRQVLDKLETLLP